MHYEKISLLDFYLYDSCGIMELTSDGGPVLGRFKDLLNLKPLKFK